MKAAMDMTEEVTNLENIEKTAEVTEAEAAAEVTEEASAEAVNPKARYITIGVTVLLGLSITLCVMVLAQVLSKGYVSIGGYSFFRVVTGSMEPEIPTGALLISEKTDMKELRVGDIVTFKSRESGMLGMLITHRIKMIYQDDAGNYYLETKGDANPYADGYLVEEDGLIGKTLWYTKGVSPLNGIFNLLTDKVGFMACIVLPCLLFGMVTMRDCIKDLKLEIDKVSMELDAGQGTPKAETQGAAGEQQSLELQLSETEYEELCERLKRELLEEMKQGVGEIQKD